MFSTLDDCWNTRGRVVVVRAVTKPIDGTGHRMYEIIMGLAVAMETRMKFRILSPNEREYTKLQGIQGGVNFIEFMVGMFGETVGYVLVICTHSMCVPCVRSLSTRSLHSLYMRSLRPCSVRLLVCSTLYSMFYVLSLSLSLHSVRAFSLSLPPSLSLYALHSPAFSCVLRVLYVSNVW